MTLAFHELAAELASLCGDFEAMEQLIDTVITQTKSLLEQANVYRIRIQANVSQNQLNEAIAIAQQFLHQLGVDFPDRLTENEIQSAIAEVNQLIGDRKLKTWLICP
jgi:predicted ATPase